MKTTQTKKREPLMLAATVAPEDVSVGDWVAVLSYVQEYPAWLYDSSAVPVDQSVEVSVRDSSGLPLKVKSLCLPFILTDPITGEGRVIDVRTCKIVRLSKRFAKEYKRLHKKQRKSGGGI